MDEVYFKATGSSNPSLNTPRNSLLSENKDKGLLFLRTLERAQFFLTHKSHSPELTNQGFPRVSMFPMDVKAVAAVGTNSLPSGVSPYDITMALNSTIGGRSNISGGNAYYFQRQDPTSRHAEFWANIPRNSAVMKYLKSLSQLPIPGYPETVPFVVPSMTPEDPRGLALASKYPPGRNGSTNKPFANLVSGSNSLADASDRTQTLWNMLDYTRTLNMQPAFITASARYDQGNGQAAGVCGCYSGGDHAAALAYTRQDKRSPKGTGKLFGPSEIAVLINVAAYREGPAPAPPSSAAWAQTFSRLGPESVLRANDSDAGTRYLVEIGFIMAGFNPKHGWAATFPQGGITVSSTIGSPSSANNAVLPIRGPEGEQLLTFDATKAAGTATRAQAKSGNDGVIPLGGMTGPRALMSTTAGPAAGGPSGIAMIRPFCIKLPTSGGGQVDLGGVLKCDPTIPIRIMPMDGASDDGNIISATDIRLPADFFSGVKCTPSNETLSQMVSKWANGTSPFPDPRVTIRSFVVPHGDYRLTVTPSRVDADVFVPVANYKQSQQAHSFYEWNSNPGKRALTGSRWDPSLGLMDPLKVKKYVTSTGSDGNTTKLTGLPFPAADPASMIRASADMGIAKFVPSDTKIEDRASSSSNPQRKKVFAHGRLDGRGDGPNRGASDPFDTGDYDTGIAAAPDGPYMNYPDEGDRRSNMKDAYYKKLNWTRIKPNSEGLSGQNISPNFLIRSPVDFGSTPTGIMNRVPWQTLRFRPDPGMNDPALKMRQLSDFPPRGLPFANFCGPKDHFFLDMFWMPVVEPYSISEPFSTKGTINLNQQIFPFMYIQRTTALHALLRGERMAAIPNTAAEKYKNVNATNGEPAASQDNTYRHFINAKETIKQIIKRYEQGLDSEGTDGFPLAFNVFRSASEICELWLVPEYEGATPVNLQSVIGTVDAQSGEAKGFWADHKLTGDNLRERPYANIYPRVTVRSNVFKLHMVAQTLQKAASQDVKRFDSTKDVITAEWRGSCMIERSIDPRDTALNNLDYTTLNPLNIDPKRTPRLDGFYTYRVTEVKQLTQ